MREGKKCHTVTIYFIKRCTRLQRIDIDHTSTFYVIWTLFRLKQLGKICICSLLSSFQYFSKDKLYNINVRFIVRLLYLMADIVPEYNQSNITQDSGQKYSDASSFPYIFHINLQFKKNYSEVCF